MFGKKDKSKEVVKDIVESVLIAEAARANATAKTSITAAIADTENKFDVAYANGLIDMAYQLEAITVDERAAFKDKVHEIERSAKAQVDAVYKKKGLYEYKGYNIIKVADNGDGAANWSIKPIGADAEIETNLTFTNAKRAIDKLTDSAI